MTLGDEQRRLLAAGIEHFNSLRFWDAHESWEAIWLESAEPEKTFLQGLIQLTAACHHFRRGTLSGGIRLADACAEKLGRFPEGFMGVERDDAVSATLRARERASELVAKGRGDVPLGDGVFSILRLFDPR